MTKTKCWAPKVSEHEIQCQLVTYFYMQFPRERLCASAGGLHTGFKQAVRMKRSGYGKGFPDITVPIPRFDKEGGGRLYHGLFIELKTESGSATREQKEWIIYLQNQGYWAEICKGFRDAKCVLDWYMKDLEPLGVAS